MKAVEFDKREQIGATDASTEASSGGATASLGVGLIGALVGSLCCLLPALALTVGLAGAAGLVQLGAYQPYFLAASLLFVGGWNWYMVQRRKSCCTTVDQRRALYASAILSVLVFLVVYVVINYAMVPWLYDLWSERMPATHSM
ncbi:MAG: hypothetical protein EPO21_15020 [Chloroflexota bacterium]|nr:MAG: hypothetical protein EPO21_15020 [Chloroflexota bacterium]